MNLPASASSFMTPSCCRCRSISLHTINIQMKFLSVLSKASRHRLFSQFFFPLQTLNTSSSIFYSNQSRSSFSLPTKSIFFPSFYSLCTHPSPPLRSLSSSLSTRGFQLLMAGWTWLQGGGGNSLSLPPPPSPHPSPSSSCCRLSVSLPLSPLRLWSRLAAASARLPVPAWN